MTSALRICIKFKNVSWPLPPRSGGPGQLGQHRLQAHARLALDTARLRLPPILSLVRTPPLALWLLRRDNPYRLLALLDLRAVARP
jgi:hypothetical protein